MKHGRDGGTERGMDACTERWRDGRDDGCTGGWRDAAPAPTRGAQAAARVSWGSWSSSAGVGWVFRGRGGHCGTAAPSVTGAAGSSGAAGEGRPPPERQGRRGRGGTAQPPRLRDPPASAAGPWRAARGWHGARAAPAPGRPPAPATAASAPPRGGGRRGLPPRLASVGGGTAGTSRGRDAALRPAFHPHCPGYFQPGPAAGAPRGHRSFRFLPAPREGGGDGVAARKDTERGTPAAGLPRLPGATAAQPPAPGAPGRR